jgi:hypothetical protein
MAGDAAAHGQDPGGGIHAANVFGAGLAPHQDAGLAARRAGLGVVGREHDLARGRAGAGGDAADNDIAAGAGVNLAVQQLGNRRRLDPQDRLLAGDHLIGGHLDGDGNCRARRALDAHRIQNEQLAAFDGELDRHFLAQAAAAEIAHADQIGKDLGAGLLQRPAALVARQIDRAGGRALERIAALALGQIAPGDLAGPRHPIDKLDHPGTTFAAADAHDHRLHHQPQPRLGGRALGLTQEAGGRAFPGARHRAQDLRELMGDILRKRLFHFVFIGVERRGQRRGIGLAGVVKHLRIEPRHMDRIGLNEAQVERGRRRLADLGAHRAVAGIVHADVEDGPRPAPVGVLRRGPH